MKRFLTLFFKCNVFSAQFDVFNWFLNSHGISVKRRKKNSEKENRNSNWIPLILNSIRLPSSIIIVILANWPGHRHIYTHTHTRNSQFSGRCRLKGENRNDLFIPLICCGFSRCERRDYLKMDNFVYRRLLESTKNDALSLRPGTNLTHYQRCLFELIVSSMYVGARTPPELTRQIVHCHSAHNIDFYSFSMHFYGRSIYSSF